MIRRYVGAVLAVVGVLLLVDVALTLTWKEPVTWFLTRNDQSELEKRFAQLDRSLAAITPVQPTGSGEDAARSEARMRQAARRLERKVENGDPIGRLEIPSIGLRMVVVQGADTDDLKIGPGHYTQTRLPGERGTVGLAGHRTTYLQPFRKIDELRPGQRIRLTMPYGRFDYVVTGRRIVSPQTVSVLNGRSGAERIVLTACHPLFSARERIVVFGRLAKVTPREPSAA